ncbi:complex I subunit 5 family protein [Lachnospiraceae bacterium C1.1]|nr:proton-conducting transporter membrane subunit [Lachnospiraceae bacterium C1.1]
MLMSLLIFFPLIVSLILIIIRKNEFLRDSIVSSTVIIELILALIICFFYHEDFRLHWFNDSYISFRFSGFRAFYALITAFMWAFTGLFSKEYFKHEKENLTRYYFFTLLTLAATEGVMLSGNFMTAFLFFEILSLSSTVWVIHEENEAARSAAYTYLFIAVGAGLVLFMGLMIMEHFCGSLEFEQIFTFLKNPYYSNHQLILTAAILIILGFGAKAGLFPLHIWLPKAHPAAPAPASALLSGILTKVGVYGILMTAVYCLPTNLYFGEILLVLALITMFLGALLALFSINLKRTLACSSMSQIGFITTGIALCVILSHTGETEGAEIALSGALLHMVNHSCLKLTLFLAAGAIYMNTEKLDLNGLRGFGRNKFLLKLAFLFGYLGISGVPFFNAYVSKNLIHEAMEKAIITSSNLLPYLEAAEWIFLISGGLTFAYMTKLFISIFVEKNNDDALQKKYDENSHYMNKISTFVIFSSSLLFIILGIPSVFRSVSSFMTEGKSTLEHFNYLSAECLKGSGISLFIGLIVYLVIIRKIFIKNNRYIDLWPERLNLETLVYKPFFTVFIPKVIFGSILSIFAENIILKKIFRLTFKIFIIMIRSLSIGTDLLIVLIRKTILAEKKPAGIAPGHIGFFRKLRLETSEAYAPIIANFSFALVLTCVGIIIILLSLLLK